MNANKIEHEDNLVGVNTVITQMRTNIPTNRSGIKTNKYSLTSSTRNVNRHNCQAELFDVIWFLPWNHRSQYAHAKLFISNGVLDMNSGNIDPCQNKCSICTGEWRQLFLPVDKVKWCEFLYDFGKVNMLSDKDDLADMWNDTDAWKIYIDLEKPS